MCTLLLNRGAKVDAVDERNQTALHCAVARGFTNACVLLLERGANVDAMDNSDQTV